MRLSFIWVILVAVIAAWLAAANRQPVWFSFDAMSAIGSGPGVNTPLFGLVLGAFGLGAICGGMAVFFSTLSVRKKAKETKKEAKGLYVAKDTEQPT